MSFDYARARRELARDMLKDVDAFWVLVDSMMGNTQWNVAISMQDELGSLSLRQMDCLAGVTRKVLEAYSYVRPSQRQITEEHKIQLAFARINLRSLNRQAMEIEKLLDLP